MASLGSGVLGTVRGALVSPAFVAVEAEAAVCEAAPPAEHFSAKACTAEYCNCYVHSGVSCYVVFIHTLLDHHFSQRRGWRRGIGVLPAEVSNQVHVLLQLLGGSGR
jgi:cyanophycinase-like exopeptidase